MCRFSVLLVKSINISLFSKGNMYSVVCNAPCENSIWNFISLSILPLTSIFIFYNLFKIRFSCILLLLLLIDWLIDLLCLTPLSAISWRSVLVVEEAGENHRPWTGNWRALSLAAASRVHPFCSLQSRARIHTVLVIGLYELLGPLLLLIYQCIAKEKKKKWKRYDKHWILIRYI